MFERLMVDGLTANGFNATYTQNADGSERCVNVHDGNLTLSFVWNWNGKATWEYRTKGLFDIRLAGLDFPTAMRLFELGIKGRNK